MGLELIPVLALVVIAAAPGIMLSFALLKHTCFNRFEKTAVGVMLGMLVAPTLAFLEFVLLGVKLSAPAVFLNYVIVLALALAALYLQKQFGEAKHLLKKATQPRDWVCFAKANAVSIILLVIVLSGFYARVSPSWNTNFFEFDPYYYTFMGEQIIRYGAAPSIGEHAYYPAFERIMRTHPLVAYETSSWYWVYSVFAGLQEFSKDALILLQQIYPAIAGALLSVFGFLLVKPYYGRAVGLVAAAFLAYSPMLVKKFAAGAAELQPMTIFLIIALLAVFAIASENKSRRLTLLAAALSFWMVLSGQQYMWLAMIFSAFIVLQAVIDFWNNAFELETVLMNFAVAAPAFAAFALLLVYKGASIVDMTLGLWLLLGAALFSALLHYSTRLKLPIPEKNRKPAVIGVIAVLLLVVMIFTSLGGQVIGMVNSLSGFAYSRSPLGNTIAEENPANEAMFTGAYGILNNPPMMLLILALAISAYSAIRLWKAGNKRQAYAITALAVVVILFNSALDGILGAVLAAPDLEPLLRFATDGDVFWYLVVALVSIVLLQLSDKHQTRLLLLYALVIFPVAYIGLNKIKYSFHLGLVLAIALAVILGESNRIIAALNEKFKFMSGRSARWSALLLVLVIGGSLAALQVTGIPDKTPSVASSMQELSYTKISNDWLLAMGWLKNNTNMYSVQTQEQCRAKFGWDCNVISWWDYGHWTNFFGETKSVLTPNNQYGDYNQEVAHGFVDGNTQHFIEIMKRHHATHVLVDAQLIQKWGALVYLSGTCTPEQSPFCPTPYIENWKDGAGKSRYEAEHYFETLSLNGECPGVVKLPALQSNFGMVFCAGQDQLLLLGRGGEMTPDYNRPYKVIQSREDALAPIYANTSYLFPYSQNTFINANPDLSPAGLNNTLINSVFVRLYLFENLEGFKLAYRSPNGEVKIFEIDPALLK